MMDAITRRKLRAGEKLAENVLYQLNSYGKAWIKEQMKDDHQVTIDHKDEIGLMETLLALQLALGVSAVVSGAVAVLTC